MVIPSLSPRIHPFMYHLLDDFTVCDLSGYHNGCVKGEEPSEQLLGRWQELAAEIQKTNRKMVGV